MSIQLKSPGRRRTAWQRAALGVFALCLSTLAPAAVDAQMPMGRPDPKQMSGLSRVDPQLAPGTVTVRCLLGSFDQPAVGFEVLLEVQSADGTVVEEHSETTIAQGRATFTGLEKFFGGTAIARVTFDGQEVRSQSIPVTPSAGSRVMLVKGAVSAPSPAADPHSGGSDLPQPGEAFPSDRFPAGTVVVGVLDLRQRKPVTGVDIFLRGTPPIAEGAGSGAKTPAGTPDAEAAGSTPDGEAAEAKPAGASDTAKPASDDSAANPEAGEGGKPEAATNEDAAAPSSAGATLERRQTIQADGRAVFPDMLGEEIPAGTTWVAEVTLPGESKPLTSKPFQVFESEGTAIYLAIGMEAASAAPGPVKRRPLMPPRRMPTIAKGVVRVAVLDANDQPLPDQPVQIIREDVTGGREAVEANTDATGVSRIGVAVSGDSLYYAQAVYGGAPYRSVRFDMNDAAGVGLELRVFETTADISKLQSEVQFVFVPRENNRVEINQSYRARVSGDKAFWPGENMQIQGAEGALGFVVMNHATPGLLTHDDKAPFATLVQPIPPAVVVDLSVAYLLEHNGEVPVRWPVPFDLVSGAAAMKPEYKLSKGSTAPPKRPEQPGSRESFDVYDLTKVGAGGTLELEVTGLPVNERAQILRMVGVGGGSLMFGGLLVLMLIGRRRSNARERLLARREKLLNMLDAVDAAGGIEIPGVERGGAASRPGAPAQRKVVIAALDQLYRDLDAHDAREQARRGKKSNKARAAS